MGLRICGTILFLITLPFTVSSVPGMAEEPPASQEDVRGTVGGKVIGPGGKPVPGAVALLCDQATGIPLHTGMLDPFTYLFGRENNDGEMAGLLHAVTDGEGLFRFPEVPAGEYRIVCQSWLDGKAFVGPLEVNGKIIQVHGSAAGVQVPSPAAERLEIRPMGTASLSVDLEAPNDDMLLVAGTAPTSADPILGFAGWPGPFLRNAIAWNRMPGGATTIHGLPEGTVYLALFANDSNPGWGEAAVRLEAGGTIPVDISIVASWSSGARHSPPERLAPLCREMKEEGYDLEERVRIILEEAGLRSPMDIVVHGDRLDLDREIEVPGGRKVRMADLLAVEAYLRLERLMRRRTHPEEYLLKRNEERSSGAFGAARPYAWERTDTYAPPDFEAFFPDDPEGGKALDALFPSLSRSRLPDMELLETVRRGLRRTTRQRTSILREIGSRYIWGKQEPNPEAVAIMYHAADPADKYGTRHHAVYFGLSTLQPEKPPAVLRALVDICMTGEEIGRITWGCRDQLEALAEYLDPHLASEEPKTRETAAALDRHFKGEESFEDWKRRKDMEDARAEYESRLPALAGSLLEGGRAERKEVFNLFRRNHALVLILDDSFLEAFSACASDPDPEVRGETAGLVGTRWIMNRDDSHRDAVDLLLRLARDPDREVRFKAVSTGLSLIQEMDEDLTRRMVDLALDESDSKIRGRICWGLRSRAEEAGLLLEAVMDRWNEDPDRARAAFACYPEIAHREPPKRHRLLHDRDSQSTREGSAAAGIGTYEATFRDLYETLERDYPCFDLKGIDWTAVGRELLPRAALVKDDRAFALLCMEILARLEDSHAVLLDGASRVPPIPAPLWHPGFACLEGEGGAPIVYHVEPNSPADRAGVKAGMTILAVDGRPPEVAIRDCMQMLGRYAGFSSDRILRYHAYRRFTRRMDRGTEVALGMRDAEGREHAFKMPADFGARYIPRLPVPIEGVSDSRNTSWKMLDGKIGYIYVRRIQDDLMSSLDRAVADLSDAKGLIVDVRGCSGGGLDADKAHINFAFERQRQAPDRPSFAGPMAVLIDAGCIGAGEEWISWFKAKGRARFFGEATAGAASRTTSYTLKNGLYRVSYPIKTDRGFLDRPIERRGIEPDVPARQKCIDLAIGRDTVLEAARAYLEELFPE